MSECFSHQSGHSEIAWLIDGFRESKTQRGVCVSPGYRNEDRSRVDIPLAEEPVAQIAPHTVDSDTHTWAYVQLLD